MAKPKLKESDLYAPVKAYFTGLGYDVKGEVGAADVVAMRAGEDQPIIVELKTGFTLSLFHQAIDRKSMSDHVYICVPRPKGKAGRTIMRKNLMLARRLSIGLMTVKDGEAVVHLDPKDFTPRKYKAKTSKLVSEFERRHGDPNAGGMTREGLMTTYRQGALRCAKVLHDEGACKASYVAKMAGVEKARATMAHNHYGWFEKIDRGIYGLTPEGAKALETHAPQVRSMMDLE